VASYLGHAPFNATVPLPTQMNYRETIQEIQNADLSDIDWLYRILSRIEDKYARGYLTCKADSLSESLSQETQDFREEMIEYCNYKIWGK
jgi:hypothetical protein